MQHFSLHSFICDDVCCELTIRIHDVLRLRLLIYKVIKPLVFKRSILIRTVIKRTIFLIQ